MRLRKCLLDNFDVLIVVYTHSNLKCNFKTSNKFRTYYLTFPANIQQVNY